MPWPKKPTEANWQKDLASLIACLDDDEKKSFLKEIVTVGTEKIPLSKLKDVDQDTMAQVIIRHHGFAASVDVVAEVMGRVPRRDEFVVKTIKRYQGKRKPEEEDTDETPAKKKKLPPLPVVLDLATLKSSGMKDLKDPKIVVQVLSVAKPFTYVTVNSQIKDLFYVTIADSTDFLEVKVFDAAKKNVFVKGVTLEISKFRFKDGYLEVIDKTVCEEQKDKSLTIPKVVTEDSKKFLTIKEIMSLPEKTYIKGSFEISKINKGFKCLGVTLKDSTGQIDIAMFGTLMELVPEVGKRLNFICFQVTEYNGAQQLKSMSHSFAEVTSL